MRPDPLLHQALRQPRPGDEPPSDLLPELLRRVPAPHPSRHERIAWMAAPLLGGALLFGLAHFVWDLQPPAPPALLLPLLAATALHALWPRRIHKD
ncbi:MAG: hypothetical protein J0L58_17000 [Burkholderiales bacterium]|nr:hypothetical protein [Burkholderiales bacterium]